MDGMNKSAFNPEWLTMKGALDVHQGEKTTSLTASIRLRKDSALWISFSKLGVYAARVLITQDSVKMMNRIDENYFEGNFEYLEKKFNLDLSFDMLQALLLGNTPTLDLEEKPKFAHDNGLYQLSSIRKKKLKKALVKPEKSEKIDDLVLSFWIDPETYKIKKQSFYDFELDKALVAEYTDFVEVDGKQVPSFASFFLDSDSNYKIELRYSKFDLDSTLTFPFKIPEKYVPVD